MTKINPIIQWWVTPKLPPEDIFANHNFISQWISHPIKRRLSRFYLKVLQKFTDIKVIAITGSTGKTTTTEILASILKTSGKTIWSEESIDPVYNIPNTILKTPWGTKFLILEMSVEYINEMDFYLWLAHPNVGIVTNIATTHTLFLKTKEGVAKEKGKLIHALDKNGIAVLNNEDALVKSFAKLTDAKTVLYGQGATICAENVKLNENLSSAFTLKMGSRKIDTQINAYGNQFVINAVAASATAFELGVSLENIGKGLKNFKPPLHRLNVISTVSNGIIFDDTYNSNPKAASESLDTFLKIAGSRVKIVVIGDMLELGEFEESSHRELGQKIGSMKIDILVGVGNASRYIVEEASKKMKGDRCFLTTNYSEALEIIKSRLGKNTALFVKGSRSIHLEKLVNALT